MNHKLPYIAIAPTACAALRRNEQARLYHWKRRKRLPPRRLDNEDSRIRH